MKPYNAVHFIRVLQYVSKPGDYDSEYDFQYAVYSRALGCTRHYYVLWCVYEIVLKHYAGIYPEFLFPTAKVRQVSASRFQATTSLLGGPSCTRA